MVSVIRAVAVAMACLLVSCSAFADSLFLALQDSDLEKIVVYRIDDADEIIPGTGEGLIPCVAFILPDQTIGVKDMASDQRSRRLYFVIESVDEDDESVESTVVSTRPDGHDQRTHVTTSDRIRDLEIDPSSGMLYWVASKIVENGADLSRVERMAPDGSGPIQTIATGENLIAVEIDPGGQKAYFLRQVVPGESAHGLFRINTDGTALEDLSAPLAPWLDERLWPNPIYPQFPNTDARSLSLQWKNHLETLFLGLYYFDNATSGLPHLAFQALADDGDYEGSPDSAFAFGKSDSTMNLFGSAVSESTDKFYTLHQSRTAFTDLVLDSYITAGQVIAPYTAIIDDSLLKPTAMAVLPSVEACTGDLNIDGTVDIGDLILALMRIETSNPVADCDGSGRVEFNDLVCMLFEFGCESPGMTFHDCDGDGIADIARAIPFNGIDCDGNGVPDICQIAANPGFDCNENGLLDTCEGDFELCDISVCGNDCNMNAINDICDIIDGTSLDCNFNGVPDECEIADGTLEDCDGNGVPDMCDPDCNGNGVADACEILMGLAEDCDRNGIPDECDPDCNGNGIPDECDIRDGLSFDCNLNGIPDECESDCNGNGIPDDCDIRDGFSFDCNANGIPDECDIEAGNAEDCNGNEIPDECELDCNMNGIPDDCDIADGSSMDCNGNGIPDDCEADCNENEIPDECDIAFGFSEDCDGNGVPDECDPDCNRNGMPDACDIANGTSQDSNGDGVPDECAMPPQLLAPPDGSVVGTLTPELRWMNSLPFTTAVVIFPAVGGAPVLIASDLPFSGPFTIPPGTLQPGTSYRWRVAVDAPGGIVNSVNWRFTVSPDAD